MAESLFVLGRTTDDLGTPNRRVCPRTPASPLRDLRWSLILLIYGRSKPLPYRLKGGGCRRRRGCISVFRQENISVPKGYHADGHITPKAYHVRRHITPKAYHADGHITSRRDISRPEGAFLSPLLGFVSSDFR